MQKVVEKVSLSATGREGYWDYNLTMRLKLYADGVDVKTAMPLHEFDKSVLIKGQVEGQTIDGLIKRATDKISEEFQVEIDRVTREQEILSKIDVKSVGDKLVVPKDKGA